MPEGTVTVRVLGSATGLAAVMRDAEVQTTGSLNRIQKSAKGASGEVENVGKKAQSSSGGLKSFAGGLGGLLVGFGGFTIVKSIFTDFNSLQAATAALGTAMKDAGEKQTPAFAKALEDAQHKGEGLGFAAGETTDMIAKLRLAGITTSQAIAAQGTIMDLAAAKHISLADATGAVIKGMQGSGKALKDLNILMPPTLPTVAKLTSAQQALAAAVTKYGPASKQAVAAHQKLSLIQSELADRTKNFGTVLDAVNPKVGGQAAAAANTTGGKLKVLSTEVKGAATQMLIGMMPAFNMGVGVISELSKHMNIVLPIIAALTVAFGLHKAITTAMTIATSIQSAAMGVATAAQWLFNAAMDANPIALVIIAVVAVGAALFMLRDHLKVVGQVAGNIFGVLKTGAQIVWNVISGIFKVTPFGFLITHISEVLKFFHDLPGHIGDALKAVGSFITAPFRAAFNFVADLWNNTLGKINFTIPGWVPVVGGKGFGFPQMPKMHTGGIVPGRPGQDVPIMAQAGERVIPANRAGASGITVTQYISSQADPAAIARAVVIALKTQARRAMA